VDEKDDGDEGNEEEKEEGTESPIELVIAEIWDDSDIKRHHFKAEDISHLMG
jgi:hypothetical protein